MSFKQHRLSALIVVAPEEAKRAIVEAFRAAGASRRDAAKALGCDEDTLAAWIKRLDMGVELEAIVGVAKLEGWHHGKVGGRPKSVTPQEVSALQESCEHGRPACAPCLDDAEVEDV